MVVNVRINHAYSHAHIHAYIQRFPSIFYREEVIRTSGWLMDFLSVLLQDALCSALVGWWAYCSNWLTARRVTSISKMFRSVYFSHKTGCNVETSGLWGVQHQLIYLHHSSCIYGLGIVPEEGLERLSKPEHWEVHCETVSPRNGCINKAEQWQYHWHAPAERENLPGVPLLG